MVRLWHPSDTFCALSGKPLCENGGYFTKAYPKGKNIGL